MGFTKVFVVIVGCLVLFVNYRIEKFNSTEMKELEGFQDGLDMLIVKAGYKCEIYEVETDDGHILKIHRVMTKITGRRLKKNPVLMMHGFLSSPISFLLTGPENALAYYFVDHGYDVWLGSSREAKSLFSNHSFNEIGLYDLPATIDGILKETHKSQLFYIGHSQAANSMLILLSSIPEYNEKIIQAHLLAPFVFINNIKYVAFKTAMKISSLLNPLCVGSIEVTPILRAICNIDSTNSMNFLCEKIIKIFITHKETINLEIFAVYLRHVPIVINFMHFHHFFQMLKSGKFRKFDYGEDLNLRIYNSSSPPDYQLSNVDVPLYIYHAEEDTISVTKDVERLRNTLSNLIKEYRVIPNWEHFDVISSNNTRSDLYGDMIKFMNDYFV